jgi:Holliday junction resolvase
MSEKEIERQLVVMVKNAGGMAPKFVSPGMDGMPDRIVLMPGGHIGFVEVKAPGRKPRKLQIRRHVILQHLGFKVYVLDDTNQIPGIIADVTEADQC